MGGISINDAMVFGKPIICSICDGTEKKLVYNDFNGLYFKDGNKDDLTKKILMILDDENKIRTMGENSTSIIKDKINIHTVISGYKNAFNYVLKTK
jgi:glycosyltransferase involved in cell wall biosynthesis